MKHTRILALLLALIFAFSLCACGNGGSTSNGSGEAEQSAPAAGEEPWDKDEAILKEHGYNVSIYSYSLSTFEKVVKAESGSLKRLISATNSAEGKVVLIYYFKTAEQASTAFAQLENVYKLVGTRIVHGDQDNLIRE